MLDLNWGLQECQTLEHNGGAADKFQSPTARSHAASRRARRASRQNVDFATLSRELRTRTSTCSHFSAVKRCACPYRLDSPLKQNLHARSACSPQYAHQHPTPLYRRAGTGRNAKERRAHLQPDSDSRKAVLWLLVFLPPHHPPPAQALRSTCHQWHTHGGHHRRCTISYSAFVAVLI
jgi:hypothetical protein